MMVRLVDLLVILLLLLDRSEHRRMEELEDGRTDLEEIPAAQGAKAPPAHLGGLFR